MGVALAGTTAAAGLACPSSIARRILIAARCQFSRDGYRKTSMEEIAAEAGLAKATLYLHFSGKEGILRALLIECRAVVMSRVESATSSEAVLHERLADLLYAYGGTAMEWFGKAEHLAEIARILAVDPDTFGELANASVEERRHLSDMLVAAELMREVDVRAAGCVEAVAAILHDAAMGSKARINGDPFAYRTQLMCHARVICAAITPRDAGV